MEIALQSCENSDSDIFSESKLLDLNYAKDIVPPRDDLTKQSVFPDRLNCGLGMFGMSFCTFEVQTSAAKLDCPEAESCLGKRATG